MADRPLHSLPYFPPLFSYFTNTIKKTHVALETNSLTDSNNFHLGFNFSYTIHLFMLQTSLAPASYVYKYRLQVSSCL